MIGDLLLETISEGSVISLTLILIKSILRWIECKYIYVYYRLTLVEVIQSSFGETILAFLSILSY